MAGHLASFTFSGGVPRGAEEPGAQDITLINIFNFIQFTGIISLAVILFTTMISQKIKRIPTWYSFIISWMVYCLSFILLIGQQAGLTPGFGVCIVQAALIYAAPAFVAWTSLGFIIQFYLIVSSVLFQRVVQARIVIFLLALPPFIYTAIIVEVLILGFIKTSIVERDYTGMYCHLSIPLQAKVAGIIIILAMLMALLFELMTAIMLYRNWDTFRRLRMHTDKVNGVSLATLLRITAFNFLPMLALGLDLGYLPVGSTFLNANINIVVATLPLAVALIFGTQSDLLHVWMFWKTDDLLAAPDGSRPLDDSV